MPLETNVYPIVKDAVIIFQTYFNLYKREKIKDLEINAVLIIFKVILDSTFTSFEFELKNEKRKFLPLILIFEVDILMFHYFE